MGVYTEDLCERLSDDLAGRFVLAGRLVPSGSLTWHSGFGGGYLDICTPGSFAPKVQDCSAGNSIWARGITARLLVTLIFS